MWVPRVNNKQSLRGTLHPETTMTYTTQSFTLIFIRHSGANVVSQLLCDPHAGLAVSNLSSPDEGI